MVEQYLIKWSKCSALSWLNTVAWESSPPLYFDLVTLTLLITTLPIHLVTITSIKIWRTTLFLELIHLCSLIITKPSVVLFYFCWWGNIEFSENVISCEVSYVWYHWLIRFQVLYVMQWWGACAWCLCWSLFCRQWVERSWDWSVIRVPPLQHENIIISIHAANMPATATDPCLLQSHCFTPLSGSWNYFTNITRLLNSNILSKYILRVKCFCGEMWSSLDQICS